MSTSGGVPPGRTIVLGERELAIGFRLIGLGDVVEVTAQNAVAKFQEAMGRTNASLLIVSESVKAQLSENQRLAAEASLNPLVVFVPTPTGDYEVESIDQLAKRILGVSLQVPN
ncbi:MAG TPA: V-type ATP synthase subunit F [Thermoplasmata archaeon]|nr:V-type ATP synthase subunit F [Thermoplasmata archaeon]